MATQGLVRTDFSDLIIMALDAFPKDKGYEYLFDATVHSFELGNRLFKTHKVQEDGGTQISRFVNYRESGTAQFVLPTQVYQPGMVNTMAQITIPWAFAHGEWSVVRFEVQSCRGEEQLVDIVKQRQVAGEVDLALLVETALWQTYDSTDATSPLGITYWIGPYATGQTQAGAFQSTGGYDAGAAAMLTTTGGLSSSTYTRWKNWTFDWNNSTGEWDETSRQRLGRMYRNLRFEAPILATDLKQPRYDKLRLYGGQTLIEMAEKKAIQQNDQVGADLGAYQGATLYRGLPIVWQSQLDTADTSARGTNPIYLVNFDYLYPIVRSGAFFTRQTFPAPQYQPDVVTTHVDASYNIICTNRQLVGGMGCYIGS